MTTTTNSSTAAKDDTYEDDHNESPALSDKEKSDGDNDKDLEAKPAAPPTPSNPPPNGGLVAWMQVLGSWILIFNTWGTIVTWGDYQTFYESGQLFTQTSSNISWIGSIQSLVVFITGAFIGPLYDRGYLKALIIVGSFGIVFGHMMLSLCTEYWQVILAQGFVVGMGGGCLFVPALAVMQPYWSTRLGLALGVAATGSSLGGVIYPIIFTRLIDRVGFPWTVRAIGFIALVTLLIPIFISKMRMKPPMIRKIIDWTVFTDGPFLLCIFGVFLGYCGTNTGFFYISYFAAARHLTSQALALYLVPIYNSMAIFGRLVPNAMADIFGPVTVIMPGSLLVAVVLLCNLAVHNEAGIVCTALFFGLLSGIFIATPPLLFVALTKDKSKLGTRMGMAYAMVGLSTLPGGPGSGAILQHDPNRLDFTAAWIWAGVLPIAAFIVFFVLRLWLVGFKLKAKV